MLISPPFLPDRGANQTDDAWIDAAMVGGQPGRGGYPVSYDLTWHGGIHLEAPSGNGNGNRQLVRAIADGTVVYVRQPTPRDTNPAHALNYYQGWTSDGCVVIRHDTEIGANAQNLPTQVTFYSITMHLENIRAAVQPGRPIYRKDELGQAGHIYGRENQIHLEIICDDDNLEQLINRRSGDLPTAANGRMDTVFGEMYFRLPANTPVYGGAQSPAANIAVPSAAPVYTFRDSHFIGVRYAGGDADQVAHRGDAHVTTYREDGTRIGDPLHEHEAEYNLYQRANEISNAYPATGRPAPSAVYELLRFGRIIGPDALNPADTPHWRQIRHDGGQGWVNLNAAGVTKFSDADFPQWKGWKLIDDSADGDSRCDSAIIKGWLDQDGDGKVDPNEAVSLLPEESIQAKLRRTICKLPTEWERGTIETRWGWRKQESDENPAPLSEDDFKRLKAHIEKLAFWEDANVGIPANHWHFQPREFIKLYRKCGWLSLNELTQLLPRRYGINPRRQTVIAWADARRRFQNSAHDLNKMFRRYFILTAARQIQFLAQTFIETAMWVTMEEFGRGMQQRRRNGTLYWPAPAMEYYTVFYGRGVMQLTWAGNYEAYGLFRGLGNVTASHIYSDARISHSSTHYSHDPRDRNGHIIIQPKQWSPRYDPQQIANSTFDACDSGGFYWISKNTGRGLHNINRVADQNVSIQSVGRVSVLVNGGGYGYAERQSYAAYISRNRSDSTDNQATATLSFSRGQTNYNAHVDFTPQRP